MRNALVVIFSSKKHIQRVFKMAKMLASVTFILHDVKLGCIQFHISLERFNSKMKYSSEIKIFQVTSDTDI